MYEFSMDQLFHMTLQGGGNSDTMVDLIADTTGGLVIAVISLIKTKSKIGKPTLKKSRRQNQWYKKGPNR